MARKTIQQLAATSLPAVGTDLIPIARGVSPATKLELADLPISDATQAALDGKQDFDAELAALAGLSSDGLIAKTGSGSAAVRTITGTSNEITLTNGSGVSGNPTVSLPSSLTFTGKTVTGGTYVSAALTAPTITGNVAGGPTFTDTTFFSTGPVISTGAASAFLYIRADAGESAQIRFQDSTPVDRWRFGRHTNNNLTIRRYDAAGSLVDTPFSVDLSTGLIVVSGDPTTSLGIATKQYVDGFTGVSSATFAAKTFLSTGSSTARSLATRFSEECNVKDYGAVGTYDLSSMSGTDDYTAIAAAFAAAESAGHKTVYFPPGTYGLSQPIVIDGDDWVIIGLDRSSTTLVAINDDNIIEIDCRSALSQRGSIRNLCFARNSATYSNTAAIRILADSGQPYGARHWTFGELFLKGVYYGVYHERTAGQLADGLNQIQWHGFNEYRNIHVPLDASGRYPNNVLKWVAGCGPHQLVLGGEYRAEAENVQMGSGDTLDGLGDFIMVGVHCVLGTTGLDVIGPSGASTYRYNITVTGCQFDVLSSSISKFRNCGLVRFMNNNWLTGIPVDYDSTVIAYQIDTPDGIQRNQSTVEDVYSVDWLHDSLSAKRVSSSANRVLAQGTTTGGTPIVGVEGSDTNVSLKVQGQGTGAVQLSANRDNYIEAVGGATGAGSVIVRPAGADTNVAFQVQGKGTGGVTLAANRTNYVSAGGANTGSPASLTSAGGDTNIGLNVQGKGTGVVGIASATNGLGFFAGAGTTKQTITGSRGGNAALESLLTALAAHGLITDSTTA